MHCENIRIAYTLTEIRSLIVASGGLAVSETFNHLVAARTALEFDFFGGWQPSDIDLFQSFQTSAHPVAGKIDDFMGIETTASLHPWAAHMSGTVIGGIPIPSDNLRAEAIEYFATFDAFRRALPSGRFSAAELGASYAPWSCVCAVLARRANLRAHVTAVEASSFLFGLYRAIWLRMVSPRRTAIFA